MKLNKLHVLIVQTGACRHAIPVPRTGMSRGAGKVSSTKASRSKNNQLHQTGFTRSHSPCGEDSVIGMESMDTAILETQSDDTETSLIAFIHQQIESEVFHKIIRVVLQ
jgi:hypothetical protein